ncbi:MAG: FGGY-family carbohydrate kinase [Candidatus Bipolaricaulota bacterium]|nr:FGGY-family carbohydrate kinase [Candidatus Bipolaricaulota bacterium]MDW8127081.1 FGGY-family carbohydrate kinase [Candidatus Bipolaricaulota bacterium]
MSKTVILAHDLGTTGDKAVAIDLYRGLLTSAFVPYETHSPFPLGAEQEAAQWWNAVCQASQAVLASGAFSPTDLAVVVFSGQMMGCLPVDAQGRPLRPAIIWADQRAVREAAELVERVGISEVYKITGHRVGPAYSGPKIAWLRHYEPDKYAKTYKFLQAKDFIVHKLTGAWVTDFSDAGGTGLLHLVSKEWSPVLSQALGIDVEKLPTPVPSTTVVGEVTAHASQATGIPKGTPVVVGGGDGVCATAGAGVTGEGEGYVYLGSSAWIAALAKKPCLDPKMRTFTWVYLDPAWFSPNGTMHNAGAAVDWVRELFGVSDFAAFEEEAAHCPAGADGLLFLPHLRGERSPFWNPKARGVFVGLSSCTTRSHIFRAALEGVALNLKAIDAALAENHVALSRIRLIGGGARSRLWAQIIADVLGRPVELVAQPLEATALGAAAAGAVGVGLAPSLAHAVRTLVHVQSEIAPKQVDVYNFLYPLFLEAYQDLVPLWPKLSSFTGSMRAEGGGHGV